MIEALAQFDPWSEVARFALVLLRVSGLVAFCPIFSSQLLPIRVRISLAFALTLVLLPIVPAASAMPAGIAHWLVVAVRELSVGLGLGLAARVVFDGIEGAARLIAGQSGFALSSMLDPLTGAQSVTPALFQALLATTLVLAADLHHLFIRALVQSYELLPAATLLPATSGLGEAVIALGGRLFTVAIVLAGPALVVTFAADLVLLLVGRAVPQIPVLMVGYPLKIAAGVVAMVILAFTTGSAVRWIGQTFSHDGAALLAAFRSGAS
jgi:flagellar biosynthetic protein FliR